MAGTFTHFMICEVAKKSGPRLNGELLQLLNKHTRFLSLGAVSPDLPYLSFKTGTVNWADVMHYEKTNSSVISGYEDLKNRWTQETFGDQEEVLLVWLLGYVSHLVIDATIHPIIQALVGPYAIPKNREPHRISEMTQDSLLFDMIEKVDIRYGDFSSILKFCKDSQHFDALMNFWKRQVEINYKEKGEEPHPNLWVTTYSEAIELAEARSEFLALFRHIGGEGSYIYKTKEEIINNFPGDYDRYFLHIKLPNESTGNFQRDGFERATNNVIDAWNSLYSGLSSEGVFIANIIKPWNLDTGVDTSVPDNEVTYWA